VIDEVCQLPIDLIGAQDEATGAAAKIEELSVAPENWAILAQTGWHG